MKNLIVVPVLLLLAACASTPASNSSQSAQSAIQPKAAAEAQTGALSQAEIDARNLAEQMQNLKNRSVYFDFDKSLVKSEYQNVIQQQADFIKAHGRDVVTLEGNCDERGSDEYNLALGDRRTASVRKELEALGVHLGQVKTTSFGETKPRLTCHEEKCWKENRRVDFNHNITP